MIVNVFISAIVFFMLTYNLSYKKIQTQGQSSRWWGSALGSIGFFAGLSNSTHTEIDGIIYGAVLTFFGYFFIGLIFGYLKFSFQTKNPKRKKIDMQSHTKTKTKNLNLEIYEDALNEYENNRNKGLYAKLFAEENGDESKVKARYIQEVVQTKSVESKSVESNNNSYDNLPDDEKKLLKDKVERKDISLIIEELEKHQK